MAVLASQCSSGVRLRYSTLLSDSENSEVQCGMMLSLSILFRQLLEGKMAHARLY